MANRPEKDHIWDSSGQINSTGSANAYVITTAEAITGYIQGMPPIRFKANFGNSGSATANVNGLGAVTLKKNGGATDLASGDIVSGGVYTLIHDGTNFQVLELNGTIPAGSVGTTQLADDAVTNAKLANMAQQTIKARKTLSTGDPEDCTLSEVLDFIGSAAQGDILFRGAAGWQRLAAGTSGHFLKSNGSGADLSYAAAGGVVLLTSGTASAVATLDLVLTAYTAYRGIIIELTDFISATDAVELRLQTSTDGGSTYDAGASDYRFNHVRAFSASTISNTSSTGSASIRISDAVGNAASDGIDLTTKIMGQTGTATNKKLTFSGSQHAGDNNQVRILGDGRRLSAADVDAIRYFCSSGNITSVSYAIYGLI